MDEFDISSPNCRAEQYLAKAVGASSEIPSDPRSRMELYLAKAVGEYDGALPEPQSRADVYLKKLAESGVSGGGTKPLEYLPGGVNFYDYEGTLLHTWTMAQLDAATELPPLPEHTGLICQGWNWTLDELKQEHKTTDVGPMFITDDGKTRIYVTIPTIPDDPEKFTSEMRDELLSVKIGLDELSGTARIDWGDGTQEDVLTGTGVRDNVVYAPPHRYPGSGTYIISIDVEKSATIVKSTFSDSPIRQLCVTKIELGKNIKTGMYAFENMVRMKSITLNENSVYLMNNAFQRCYSLKCVIFPRFTKSVGAELFTECSSLKAVSIPMLYFDHEIRSNTFSSCYSIEHLTFETGAVINDRFHDCSSLKSLSLHSGKLLGSRIVEWVPPYSDNFVFLVPKESVDELKADLGWFFFADCIVGE